MTRRYGRDVTATCAGSALTIGRRAPPASHHSRRMADWQSAPASPTDCGDCHQPVSRPPAVFIANSRSA